MSTSETDEYVVDDCPCGLGKIYKRVTTQDNPWSNIDVSYGVSCSSCGPTWIARTGYLSHAGDESERDDAFKALMSLDRQIADLMETEINSYFSKPEFKSMASQQRELSKLLLRPRDIRTFREGRNRGKRFSDLCHLANNYAWLSELAQTAERRQQLTSLIESRQRASDQYTNIKVRTHHFSR